MIIKYNHIVQRWSDCSSTENLSDNFDSQIHWGHFYAAYLYWYCHGLVRRIRMKFAILKESVVYRWNWMNDWYSSVSRNNLVIYSYIGWRHAEVNPSSSMNIHSFSSARNRSTQDDTRARITLRIKMLSFPEHTYKILTLHLTNWVR